MRFKREAIRILGGDGAQPRPGGGQIPVAALQKLAPETGHLGVVTTTGATLTLGSYTVSVHAGTHAVTPEGDRVSGPVTFQ